MYGEKIGVVIRSYFLHTGPTHARALSIEGDPV